MRGQMVNTINLKNALYLIVNVFSMKVLKNIGDTIF